MQPNIKDDIQSIRNQLDAADRQVRHEAQIGMTMIAVSQLLDLTERLYKRIVDLEADLQRVQNAHDE